MEKPRRGRVVQVRLSETEKEDVERAAQIEGLSLSAWLRLVVRNSARRTLAKAGRRPSINGGIK
jgi:uncharacterized protein (DUF1778 family)